MDVENMQFTKIFIMVSHTVPAPSIHAPIRYHNRLPELSF